MLDPSFTADDLSAREVLERFRKIFGREMSEAEQRALFLYRAENALPGKYIPRTGSNKDRRIVAKDQP